MMVKARLDIIEHAELVEEPDILEGPRDAPLIDLDTALPGDVLAVEEDSAALRTVDPGQKVENRGFPRTVRPDQAIELLFLDLEIKIIHGLQSPEGDAESLCL